MERLVIKILLLLFIVSCKTHYIESNNSYDIDKIYYEIINNEITKSNVDYKKTIDFFTNSKKYSQKEKEEYISIIKKRKKEKRNYVFYKQDNESIVLSIKKNLRDGGNLLDFFGETKLQNALLGLGKENTMNKHLLNQHINITKKTNEFWHQFSSPIVINNEVLIYHAKKTINNKFNDEIIVYNISESNKPKFKRRFFSPISNVCSKTNTETYDIKKNYYSIINSIILKSKNEINIQIPLKTSDNYINLVPYNKFLIYYIKENLKNGGHLLNYFCEKKLKNSLFNLQKSKDTVLVESYLDPSIKIIKNKNEFGHSFSTPVVIDNKLLIFHMKKSGKYNYISEFLVYELSEKNEPILRKRFNYTIS